MKAITLLILAMICTCYIAQEDLFVRIYSLSGQKIAKGKVYTLTDSTILLRKGIKLDEIPVSSIGSIRTKRSIGNNLLTGAIPFGSLAAYNGSKEGGYGSPGWAGGVGGAAMGAVIGGGIGAILGGLTIPLKHSKKFLIHGDLDEWKDFKYYLATYKNRTS